MYTKILFLLLFMHALVPLAQDNNYGVKGYFPKSCNITDSGFALLNGLKAGYERPI